jgi:hypothetical protein
MPTKIPPFLYVEGVGHCHDCNGPIDSYMGCACDPPFVSLIKERESPFMVAERDKVVKLWKRLDQIGRVSPARE